MIHKQIVLSGILALIYLNISGPVCADVKLPLLFGSNMVFQQNAELSVWGWAEPGEKVSVTLGKQTVKTDAGKNGNWSVKFKPMPATMDPLEMVVQGKNTIRLVNILIGEVWLCSGQSNMAQGLSGAKTGKEAIVSASNYPGIRVFREKWNTAIAPQQDVKEGQWAVASPESVGHFSAVGYFFGLEIYQELKVPVGLIQAAMGGSGAQSWTSRDGLKTDFQRLIDDHEALIKAYPANEEKLKKLISDYGSLKQEARKNNKPAPVPAPEVKEAERVTPTYFRHPSVLYNGMIAPLIPFAIRGVIWYQGEEDAPNAMRYRTLFPTLIRDWRRNWGQGDFPFYYVQLANWRAPSHYEELREAQLMTLSETNTGMAVTIDVGDPADVHYKNKQEVGHRLALIALANTYGKDIAYSGPIYESMKKEGDAIRLTFRFAWNGLVAKAGELKGFEIAGEDRKFIKANARIEDKTVVVRGEGMKNPVAARYAYENAPECNLYNKEGLPASPFRTDDWPRVTDKAK